MQNLIYIYLFIIISFNIKSDTFVTKVPININILSYLVINFNLIIFTLTIEFKLTYQFNKFMKKSRQ